MSKVELDTSELRALAADMRAVPEHLGRHVAPVVKHGAQNIKDDMVSAMRGSSHFKSLARSISYDTHQTSFAGDGVYEAEIGPDHERGGALANIAYFGASRGGGGRVEDPQVALDRELPKFEQAMGDLLEDLL